MQLFVKFQTLHQHCFSESLAQHSIFSWHMATKNKRNMLRPVPLDDDEPLKKEPAKVVAPWPRRSVRSPTPAEDPIEESSSAASASAEILVASSLAVAASKIPAEKDEPVPMPMGMSRQQRKEWRSQLRAKAHKDGRAAPKTFNPSGYMDLPPICNRVAAEWGQPPLPCACKDEWPRFLSQALPKGQARIPPY